ncbi:hypothetical protein, partial [Thermococcus peptonophilus]|uniref:hypothetical protein n=1 Tax=Thermococcus peptonophilus TaxID=53952 RepID=UPI003465F1C0
IEYHHRVDSVEPPYRDQRRGQPHEQDCRERYATVVGGFISTKNSGGANLGTRAVASRERPMPL